jgi:hypothetical protein
VSRAPIPDQRIAEARAQRGREVQAIIARMEQERAARESQLAQGVDPAKQALIETEIVHLALALAELRGGHYASS